MRSKEIVKQLRAEAAQLNKAADMIEGTTGKRGRVSVKLSAEPGSKRRGRPPKKKVEESKS